MKFFIDGADVNEIRELAATGMVDGVTTNPSLVAKTGRPIKDVIAEICSIVPGPVSAEVTATDYDGMLREAATLSAIAKNVTIKVPLTWDGLRACRKLTSEGKMVNVTLCFDSNQALLAA
ncbi:MAG TPA: transaldolase family protein, partial [Bauldia sp.]|nr:transaldolase family protein [Bauldia sp.]